MGVKLQSSSGGSVDITAPVTASNYVLTAPAATDTLVGATSAQTLTNKTLTSPTINMGVKLQSSSGGSVEIAAPVTASNYVLTAPAANGTILNDASSLAATNLTGDVAVARLVSAFSGSNVSLATNGYQKLPSGLIIQWGSVSTSGSGGVTLTYPISFPSVVTSGYMQLVSSPGSTAIHAGMDFSGLSSMTVYARDATSSTYVTVSCKWLAIGY